MTILRLVRQGIIKSPQIFYDDSFRKTFSIVFRQYAGDADRDRPSAPFFHLAMHGFWRLIPSAGQETALADATTVGSSGDLQRLVSFVEIDQSVFDLMRDQAASREIELKLESTIRAGIESRSQSESGQEEHGPHSLFAHEAEAIAAIRRYVEAHNLGDTLSNLELHDPQTNRYFETDLVVVASFGVYVVELKHWSGRIEVRPNSWLQNGSFFKQDPHKVNNFKAKLLRGLYDRKFPHYPPLFFESVVVLTNPDVEASGCSIPKTEAHNPTFESIDRLHQYLKSQRQAKDHRLTEQQRRTFSEYVRKLHAVAPPRDFVFPGYEVVEKLYQYDDRAEVVARRTDIRHRRLTRLRIFYVLTGAERDRRLAHERATATLNAVEKIGDHPNILRVWDVPNENNYIVEGSDWSETGTLRDVLDRAAPLEAKKAAGIAVGLARGLQVAHAQCVVHRALSPDNVLMVNETPKLMNFDLSFQLEDNRVTVIPDATKLKRSPYFAPEIYVSGTVPEATADLFSLGVILYEMLVGERPFGCSTDLEQTNGGLTADHRQKLQQRNVPEDLIDLVLALVRQNPSDRISEAGAVLARLEGEERPELREANACLPEGAQSGLYSVQKFVCSGAEAQIYRAAGVRGRPVALKLFNCDVPLQRIVEEQGFAAAAHHPGIVRVDAYSQWSDGRYYIAFEWVSERNLRNDIDEGVRPSLERFVRGAEQLLDAVASLHRNTTDDGHPSPILHNDIKPENILLGQGGRLVLIDFGAASDPHVGTYEGTEGYVAPDLRLGQDRKYSVNGDLYALSVTLHEWLVGVLPRQGREYKGDVPPAIIGWVRKGCSPKAEQRFDSFQEMRQALQEAVAEVEQPPMPASSETVVVALPVAEAPRPQEPERLRVPYEGRADPNPIVSYLNSLHSRSAASENALAESQALNPFFGHVHVPHPVAHVIRDVLTGEDRKHIVLTGHAGDGKSTIAVELFKRLNGLPMEQPLRRSLNRREDIASESASISLVKDFSEWSPSERDGLMLELLNAAGPRFFLISNTGTLLATFKDYEKTKEGDSMRAESDLLGAMNKEHPTELQYRGTSFVIINVAMMDNLGIAEQIFERMLSPELWKVCTSATCRNSCPIYQNVSLIQDNLAVVRKRLFLAYRRMYEYGTRLTLRQLCAHMAYMVTAGLEYQDIVKMSQRAKPPLVTEFMFFNRFFGDNGQEVDAPAAQLRSVLAVREQAFGSQPCPTWERRLWQRSRGLIFELAANKRPNDFETLRRCGAGLELDNAISRDRAREQVRRAVYFLHDFGDSDDGSFLRVFLRSNMILDFTRWQSQSDETLSLQEGNSLHRRIMHVLQEHFTGVRLPEGETLDRYLFITLSRRTYDVRQSAQVVLARYPEDDFQIRLRKMGNAAGEFRRELVLEDISNPGLLSLRLSLPFLDYVMLRNRGEIGKALQASYVDRLERFKGQLIRHATGRRTDDVMLVRLRTNHTFRRQIFAVRDGRLEVTDA
jgi:serine/threonine protein kinase